MLGAVFFVVVVVLLSGHYVLVERPRRVAGANARGPLAMPLRDLVARLPAGVFLQPGFTWAQVRSSGDVHVGVHPMLLSLIGHDPDVEMRAAGEHVDKGDPLVTLRSGERQLVVRSPVAGRITASGGRAPQDTVWQARSEKTCVIRPEGLSDELPGWLIGKAAADWSRAQYGQIRDYLMSRSADPEAGLALADGGELPIGVLAQVDDSDWADFERMFLTP